MHDQVKNLTEQESSSPYKDKSIGYPNFLLIFYLIFSLNFKKEQKEFTLSQIQDCIIYLHLHLAMPLKCCYPFLAINIVPNCHSPRGLKRTMVNTNFKMKSEVVFKL